MKLHNLLLTAALFVTATIASAVEPVQPEAISDPLFQRDPSVGYWNISGGDTLDIVVLEKANGYGYELVGYDNQAKTWKTLKGLNSGTSIDKTPYAAIYNAFNGNGNYTAYELSVTIEDPNIDKVSVIGHNGSLNNSVIAAINSPAGNDSIFVFRDNYSNAVGFVNGGLKGIVVMKGATYVPVVTPPDGPATSGSPLPAPVATLLIALGFGAALVMYRNRKQVKA